jgi:hypothetical protein
MRLLLLVTSISTFGCADLTRPTGGWLPGSETSTSPPVSPTPPAAPSMPSGAK